MRAPTFTVGLVQMACSSDQADNLDRATALTRKGVKEGAEIICLQELFYLRYFCQREDVQYFDLAESIPGPTTELFADLAKELECVLIVPIFELRAPGLSPCLSSLTGPLLEPCGQAQYTPRPSPGRAG